MKSFLVPTYTFTPGAAGVGTVDLSTIANFDVRRLVAIINQTDGILIYSTASITKGFTAEAAGIVTLQFSTTGMSAGDKLQIIYEDAGRKASAESSPVVLSTEQEAKLDSILTELQLKANLTDTQPVSFAPGAGGASDATLIEVRDLSGGTIIDEADIDNEVAIGVAGDRVPLAVRPDGRLHVYDLWTQQEVTALGAYITGMAAKLPSTVGQKANATSLGVSLSTEQEAILSLIATAAKQDLLLAELQLKADLTETQPVSAASLPLPSGAATATKQDDELTQLMVIDSTLTGISAKLPASVGQKAMAASLSIVIASDQSNLPVTQTALTGTFQEDLTVGAGAETFTAPAGAKWCKIQADDTNTVNIRVKIGATATASSGHQFQPGRSEDFQVAGNISYISESTTGQKLCVTFGA